MHLVVRNDCKILPELKWKTENEPELKWCFNLVKVTWTSQKTFQLSPTFQLFSLKAGVYKSASRQTYFHDANIAGQVSKAAYIRYHKPGVTLMFPIGDKLDMGIVKIHILLHILRINIVVMYVFKSKTWIKNV